MRRLVLLALCLLTLATACEERARPEPEPPKPVHTQVVHLPPGPPLTLGIHPHPANPDSWRLAESWLRELSDEKDLVLLALQVALCRAVAQQADERSQEGPNGTEPESWWVELLTNQAQIWLREASAVRQLVEVWDRADGLATAWNLAQVSPATAVTYVTACVDLGLLKR